MAIPLNISTFLCKNKEGVQEKRLCVKVSGLTTVDIETIAQEVSDKCTITRADVMTVFSELESYVGDQLLQGKNVRLHALGSFRTTLCSLPQKPEDFTAACITRVNVRYTTSGYLRKALNLRRLKFEKCRAWKLAEAAEKA